MRNFYTYDWFNNSIYGQAGWPFSRGFFITFNWNFWGTLVLTAAVDTTGHSRHPFCVEIFDYDR